MVLENKSRLRSLMKMKKQILGFVWKLREYFELFISNENFLISNLLFYFRFVSND